MPKYVAFLRGIMPMNPNMRNEKLRGVLEGLGFKNVQSVIASGNVIFESDEKDSKKLAAKIEPMWLQQLGFNSTTIVWSQAELEKLVKSEPFKGIEDTPNSRLNVTFLQKPSTVKMTFPFQAKDHSYKILNVKNQVLFSVIDLSGSKTPDLMVFMEKQWGKAITTRTWKTVHRILAKMQAES